MTSSLDKFIQADRTFHEFVLDAQADDDADLTRRSGCGQELRWSDLIGEHRVILLSEAGAGKTMEVRNAARGLRQSGKSAFFLRIEHVVQAFEESFEEGSFEDFNAWVSQGSEGWIFLDSVDEARLRDPRDFEFAIKKLGRRLGPVLPRAHIVVTGRTSAWRAKTDLLLCRTAFPFATPKASAGEESSPSDAQRIVSKTVDQRSGFAAPFMIVALDDLHGSKIDAFLQDRKVGDAKAFKEAVERKDAWSLTTRPQDLTELIEFWNSHQRIGSRLELMKSSIARRLKERDQDRAEARPIAFEKLRRGARLLAAATTLAQQSTICIPDGSDNAKGLQIREVLPDWDDTDCATLLSRPIFDGGIYGTVRFHHRSVREYLTAEWLHTLIVDEGSRTRIEDLFFRSQYGIPVIVPTMRPVLPWLAMLDERILARTCRVAPEVIFEGGDPSQLPRDTRRSILQQACTQLLQPAHSRSFSDYAAIQRFASPDLTEDVKALLTKYGEHDDVVRFLLRMVWQGQIAGAAAEVKCFALSSKSKYTRIVAFKALLAVGSVADQSDVRSAFLQETGEVHRDWLAELIPSLPVESESVEWVLKALHRVRENERFATDKLANALMPFIAGIPLELIPKLVAGFHLLLQEAPVVERYHCEISKRYSWLLKVALQSIIRMIEARHPATTGAATLSTLLKASLAEHYSGNELRNVRAELAKGVAGWPALNHALFWKDVAETRATREGKSERLIDFWHVGMFGRLWGFTNEFDTLREDIVRCPLLDDRLVALTLAFQIYRSNGRPIAWRRRLKRLVGDEPELKSALGLLLRPPAQGRQTWRQREARWKKREAREADAEKENRRRSKEWLTQNAHTLCDSSRVDVITEAQNYLLEEMRQSSSHSDKWNDGNWLSLIPEFGEPVARAFHDGVVRYWRGYRPVLQSEGAATNSTPLPVVFGLTGLSIEAEEVDNWPSGLSTADALVATRYALLELNGFPTWLPRLYSAHPEVVISLIVGEIDHELAYAGTTSESNYVLYDVSWSGSWMWDRLAPMLVERLDKANNIRNLRHMLVIIQGSRRENELIAQLAEPRAKAGDSENAPMWFAMWMGADASAAIPALVERLAGIQERAEATLFAMRLAVALMGDRIQHSSARQAYRTVQHMKDLYLLMHQYVREDEDIERAGKGVYSPGLRDEAQDARNALLSFIRETPGKDAFLALMEISPLHPTEGARPWMEFHAKEKAARDADLPAWAATQVREFHADLERTPSNHRELFDLAVDRLMNLKADLEEGDASIASILRPMKKETEIRKFIGGWCRDRARGRYTIPQEEELADAKRPDLRFHGVGFDGPVPAELKLADNWRGPQLIERLETQLCGDYLRDQRSGRGIFGLIYHGDETTWKLPDASSATSFDALVEALQNHWSSISPRFPGVEEIRVIGIDLTKRGR